MASITFKDVGQGDSIILEWEDAAGLHVGVLDCNKKSRRNPVLEHIIAKGYTHIDFMILSHPHEDHYSGFTELLEYCDEHNITVGWFGDTAFNLGKYYWTRFEKSHEAIQDLEKLLRTISRLYKEKLIQRLNPLLQNVAVQLSPDLSIRALSPGHPEMQEYQERVSSDAGANKREASQAANLLSTVFLISSGDKHALVTADAVASTLDRLHNESELSNLPLVLVQAPHHGSRKNYSVGFWQSLQNIAGRGAVISSGHNDKYQHPHLDVLVGLQGLGFSIHATNIVHGMREYLTLREKTILLDITSELIDDREGGDKSFSL